MTLFSLLLGTKLSFYNKPFLLYHKHSQYFRKATYLVKTTVSSATISDFCDLLLPYLQEPLICFQELSLNCSTHSLFIYSLS